ncbi:MAG: hypothetical protein KF760_23705 [Candidatus Eremiobacteraeota bacterium]|nr:hypothetical protein [Candidatus Eremiobacteraeota bacterium]MCW5866231.1 hypothetical protein [Candidatus Eremiobacteraeota bacterium]
MDKLVERMALGLLGWLSPEPLHQPKPPKDQGCPPDLRQAIWEEVVCARKGKPFLTPAQDTLPRGMRLVIRSEIYRQLGLSLPDPEATLAPLPQRMLNIIRHTIGIYLQEPIPEG